MAKGKAEHTKEQREAFGRRVDDCMKSLNLSNRALAKMMVTSDSNVGRWRNGQVIPDSKLLNLLAEYLEVTPQFLMGEPEKNINPRNMPCQSKRSHRPHN